MRPTTTTKKLNLGCGTDIKQGYVNVDIRDNLGVDKVVNLNKVPWKFKDGEFDEIYAKDVLEHLGGITKIQILEELARIAKTGARVIIRVPCATHYRALASLQHAHSFFYNSFDYSWVQKYFRVDEIRVGLTDDGRMFKLNGFWQMVCKHTKLVWVITFHLRRL